MSSSICNVIRLSTHFDSDGYRTVKYKGRTPAFIIKVGENLFDLHYDQGDYDFDVPGDAWLEVVDETVSRPH